MMRFWRDGPLGTARDPRRIVVVATSDGPRAYSNRCPHMYSALETFPDRFLDRARENLVCSTHGARFRVIDDVCIAGPCVGFELEALAITVIDGHAFSV